MLGRTPTWSRVPLAVAVTIAVCGAARADKRPLPDYDGRPARTRAVDVALWVPRVIFFPLYVVTDYGVRRPLGWVLTTAERELASEQRGEGGGGVGFGVLPIFTYRTDFKPRVGLRLGVYRLLARAHSLRTHLGFWGPGALSVALLDRVALGAVTLDTRLGWERRPDDAFWGIGPGARDADRARVENRRLNASFGATVALGAPARVTGTVALRDVAFRDATCCGDPAIDERIAAGVYPAPHGLASGPLALAQRLELSYEPRTDERWPRIGLHAAAAVEHATDLGDAPDDWLAYGATVGGFVDLTRGRGRIVDLSLTARFARPLDGDVPFTELVALGGRDLAGFPEGRLLGESALAGALRYDWPVWPWLHGGLVAEVGNVFGRDLDGLDVERMRLSLAVAIRTFGRHSGLFEILVGAATEPFDEGGGLGAVRVAIGIGHAP